MKKIVNVIKKVFLAIWSFILSLFSKSKVKKTNNVKVKNESLDSEKKQVKIKIVDNLGNTEEPQSRDIEANIITLKEVKDIIRNEYQEITSKNNNETSLLEDKILEQVKMQVKNAEITTIKELKSEIKEQVKDNVKKTEENKEILEQSQNKQEEKNISENKDYVKTYIYEESGELKEIKRSFEMNVKESAIEIAIYNGDEDVKYSNIEFTEGLINKKFKYVNYFDGKLYFYKDEEKAENIGVYECTNKNYVKSENDNYDYCFVAVDTIYEDNDMTAGNRNTMIPLINEKYVFVTDGPNTIKLYDLDSDKVLGTYTSVDTNLPSNNKEINKYTGKLEVIALNKKGKYGVLSIDGKSVEAKYSFEYNHLEKLGEYYLAQDADNKWKILYGKDKTSASVANKIRGYNSSLTYIKVKSGSGYAVYSETGEMMSDETYEYVELYKDFYAAVDKDKNIYVYDYQGRKLTDIAVKASSTDYGNLEYPAFKVEQNKTMFNISVYDGTKYTVTAVAEVSAGSEAGEVVEES